MDAYIGIDISKQRLDIDCLDEKLSCLNTDIEINKFIKKLQKVKSKKKSIMVICEASGGYERKLVQACYNAEISIHIAHANKVRSFAKSQGLTAKTDQLDAKVLSDYGRLLKPNQHTEKLSQEAQKIRKLLQRRSQLLREKLRDQNRLEVESEELVLRSIQNHVCWLIAEIEILESELTKLQKSESIKVNHQLLTSIPGIGDLVANHLIAFLPELGSISHKAIAALVGVAPFNRDSGKFRGKRFIQGGRAKLRHILYMSAIASTRWNPELKIFYQRLRNAGKAAKVAMIALVRKLLTMANSVISRQTAWLNKVNNNAILV